MSLALALALVLAVCEQKNPGITAASSSKKYKNQKPIS
jgi:hypothetical protein